MDKLKVGVVGIGHLGASHARTYRELPGVELVGVFDTDRVKSREISRQLDCKEYDQLDRLLDHVQAVSIVVPTEFHYEVGMRVLDRGIHVLIEKPITKILEEADELIENARKRSLVLQVGHIERFNPVVQKGMTVLDNPLFLECHRLAPFRPRGTDVDVILDLMIHDIDLTLKFVRSEVETISAVGIPVITDKIDIANARLTFKNSAVANITASRISKSMIRKMRLFQRDAYVSMDFQDRVIEVIRLNREMDQQNITDADNLFACDRTVLDETLPLSGELASFTECVRLGKDPEVSGQAGRRALAVAREILTEIVSVNRTIERPE